MRRRTLACLSLAGLLSSCFRDPKSDLNIVNGRAVSGYPFVRMVLSDPVMVEICTGVVVSDSTMLLAGHCIQHGTVAESVKDPVSGTVAQKLVLWNRLIGKKYLTGDDGARDLAVAVFPKGTFAPPYGVVTSRTSLESGSPVDLVGYGATEFGKPLTVNPIHGAIGEKNLGSNVITKVLGGVIYIEADVGADGKLQGGRALAAAGDSGSPMFLQGTHEVIGIGAAVGALDAAGRLLPLEAPSSGDTKELALRQARRVRNLYVDLTDPISRRLLGLAVFHGATIPGVDPLPNGELPASDTSWMIKTPASEVGVGDYRGIFIPFLMSLLGQNGSNNGSIRIGTNGSTTQSSTVSPASGAGGLGLLSLFGGRIRINGNGATVSASTAGAKTPSASPTTAPKPASSPSPSQARSSTASSTTVSKTPQGGPKVVQPVVPNSPKASEVASLTTAQQKDVKDFDNAIRALVANPAIAATPQGKALADTASYCAGRVTGDCNPTTRWQAAQQACKVANNWDACSTVNSEGETFAKTMASVTDAQKKALESRSLSTAATPMTGQTLSGLAKLDQFSGKWDPPADSVQVPASKPVEAAIAVTEARSPTQDPSMFDNGYKAYLKKRDDIADSAGRDLSHDVKVDPANQSMANDPSFIKGMEKAKADQQYTEAFFAGALNQSVDKATMTPEQLRSFEEGVQAAQAPASQPEASPPKEYPVCRSRETDPDGDGWGYEDGQSCTVPG